MNGAPLGVQRLKALAFHCPWGVKRPSSTDEWSVFCDSEALAGPSEGLASFTVDAFNAFIEHLLCAPVDPCLWQ